MIGLDEQCEVLPDKRGQNKGTLFGGALVIGTGGSADAGNQFPVDNNFIGTVIAETDIKGGVILKRDGSRGGSGPEAAGK